MGIDYSYLIFVRPERARDLLAAIAEVSGPGDRTTTIELPDGSTFIGPWDNHFKSGTTVRLTDNALSLGMSLCFPDDDRLREYVDDQDPSYPKPVVAWPDMKARS